jgi:alcohol dehydrogenase, propanol-preferring
MRAMQLDRPAPIGEAPLRLVTRAAPEPGAGEVLVRVAACGICRTDLHVVEGELAPVKSPIVPGHQVVGRIEAVGDGVQEHRAGERVGVAWLGRTCGVCAHCRAGRENLCERAAFTGYHLNGGYADFAVARADFVYAIPDVFDDAEAAPLLCAGIIGYRALRRSRVRPGQRLLMYGFGSSAHLTLQVALARGVEVYVCTREASHRALALSLGAAWAGGLDEPPPAPAEAAIVFAPAGELVPLALRRLAPGGTVALAGIYMTAIPPLDYADLYRERSVTTVTANTREDGHELLAEAGRIGLRPTMTRFPLTQANHALQALKAGAFAGSGVLLTGGAGGV